MDKIQDQQITLSGATPQTVQFDLRQLSRLGYYWLLLEKVSGTIGGVDGIDVEDFPAVIRPSTGTLVNLTGQNLSLASGLDLATPGIWAISLNQAHADNVTSPEEKYLGGDGLAIKITGDAGDGGTLNVRLIVA